MKKFIALLLLCSVYFSYGQQRTTRTDQAIAIVNGEIIPMEQFNRMTLGDIGGVRAVHNGVSAEKRDSLIGVFGDILPPREFIIYIETGTVTEGESTPIVLRDVRGEQNEVLARQARASLFPFAPGDEVPDFTLNDVNGNPFMLSSLRGQYVLLNFWGTWCTPCIAGIPRMKEIYEIYKDIIRFVGVASRERSVEVWREGVERHELPWINVLDETGNITTKYNIGVWPTYHLVDPEGRFVAGAFADPRMLSMVLENTFGGRGRSVAVGDKAPDFTLNDVSGNSFTLSSLQGRYVLLNFWGTWCAPCIRGIPRMKEFYEKHQHNIDIVGVATRESSVENWQAEVERLELPWINVFNDSVSAIHEKYDIGGFPTKLLVSPDGTVLLRHVGGNIGNFYERVENIIGQ